MILLALKSLFFVAAIFAYSTGVWRLINDYFRQEFRTFLDNEVKKNKHLMVDPNEDGSSPLPPKSPVEIISEEEEVRKAKGSVPGNRLLDELIVNFGRVFTAGNGDAMRARKENFGKSPSNEIISPTLTDAPTTASGPVKTADISRTSPDPEDPGGGGAGTVIESDKFPRSSPSEQEDNKSDGNDDDGAGDANNVDDGEEKWITYWKNREREQSVTGVGGGGEGDYCEATKVDACGP